MKKLHTQSHYVAWITGSKFRYCTFGAAQLGPEKQFDFLVTYFKYDKLWKKPMISLELALLAYAQGYFPMAESKDDLDTLWVRPQNRGLIPLDRFHIPHKLAQKIRNTKAHIRCDHDFEGVLSGCRTSTETRRDSWINDDVYSLYLDLFEAGYAHSIEYWEDDQLLGGLYGLHIGAIFFGESMFSRVRDASKICLAHLVANLKANNFQILDAQFINEHLKQFGAYEMPHDDFMPFLTEAVNKECSFDFDEGRGRMSSSRMRGSS